MEINLNLLEARLGYVLTTYEITFSQHNKFIYTYLIDLYLYTYLIYLYLYTCLKYLNTMTWPNLIGT